MRALTAVFGMCLIFQLFGFAYIAYPSAGKAYYFYGDFHGGPPDSRYADALNTPWNAIPPFGLFFIEGKVIKTAIDAVHPPQSETEQRENATRAVIAVGILSRTLALIILYYMIRSLRVPPYAGAGALALFSFQYTNIALTQSMKFVAGLPFFILWLWSSSACNAQPTKRRVIIHYLALLGALSSQQWILFAVIATYLLHPGVKRACGLPIHGFNLAGVGGATLAILALYFTEAARILHGHMPLVPIMPSFNRSLYLYEYPSLLAILLLACSAGLFLYAKNSTHHNKRGLPLAIIPLALFSRAITFIHPSIFMNTHFMIFFFPYWALVSCALFMIIKNAFTEDQPTGITTLAITLWLASALPQLMLVLGISIPISPVLDAAVTPVLVLAAGSRPSKAFPVFLVLVLNITILSTYKFLNYTHGWEMLNL